MPENCDPPEEGGSIEMDETHADGVRSNENTDLHANTSAPRGSGDIVSEKSRIFNLQKPKHCIQGHRR
ncbi:unnamed protein product [Callosobruchus maculatus]|uniref:Uncharacterized protein n=1 Tax=Callosobruchus maculatus TaxID=64391 RepID=A0A653C423_CALMS|nr:unnamed protein product [Callosobruchus maculatus]